MKKILFITWDGPQVNYLENLFLPIFLALKEEGYQFHVIQYTWGKSKKAQEACNENNIPYKRIDIFKKLQPLGAFFTLIKSALTIKKYIKDHNIDLIMPRSVYPLFPSLLLRKKKLKIIYDSDGFMLDERVEFGNWNKNSITFRFLKWVELKGILKSDLILTRTEKAKTIIYELTGGRIEKNKIKIVSNGRDPNIYKPNISNLRAELEISEEDFVLLYVGSYGEQYCFIEMMNFYLTIPFTSKFIILTNNPKSTKAKIKQFNFNESQIIIKSVSADDVPKYLDVADLGLNFRKQSFSTQAVNPIKIGEYLMCGVPVISTKGLGNSEEIIKKEDCGYVLNDFSLQEFKNAINWINNFDEDKSRIRNIGVKYFGLENSVNEYKLALKSIK